MAMFAVSKTLQRSAAAAAAAGRTGSQRWRAFSASVNPENNSSNNNNDPNTDHEHGKMMSEGGGSVDSYSEAKESVKASSGGIMDGIKHQVELEVKNAKEVMEDMKKVPQKTAETTQELKETVVIAGQALKRDAERVAEKIGVRERKPGDLENE